MNFSYIPQTQNTGSRSGPQCSYNAQGNFSCQSQSSQSSQSFQSFQSSQSSPSPCPCKSHQSQENFAVSATSLKNSVTNMYENALRKATLPNKNKPL